MQVIVHFTTTDQRKSILLSVPIQIVLMKPTNLTLFMNVNMFLNNSMTILNLSQKISEVIFFSVIRIEYIREFRTYITESLVFMCIKLMHL